MDVKVILCILIGLGIVQLSQAAACTVTEIDNCYGTYNSVEDFVDQAFDGSFSDACNDLKGDIDDCVKDLDNCDDTSVVDTLFALGTHDSNLFMCKVEFAEALAVGLCVGDTELGTKWDGCTTSYTSEIPDYNCKNKNKLFDCIEDAAKEECDSKGTAKDAAKYYKKYFGPYIDYYCDDDGLSTDVKTALAVGGVLLLIQILFALVYFCYISDSPINLSKLWTMDNQKHRHRPRHAQEMMYKGGIGSIPRPYNNYPGPGYGQRY